MEKLHLLYKAPGPASLVHYARGLFYKTDIKGFIKQIQNIVPYLGDSKCGRLVSMHTTDMFLKIAEFVLTSNYNDFGRKVFHQISRTAIGTEFALLYYASTFMGKFRFL